MLLVFTLSFLISVFSFGQGVMRGVITDSVSNSALVGANIYFMGTSIGASTNLEGEYVIKNIPEGNYTVKVSYIGYVSKETEVTIQPNKSTLLDVTLVPDVLQREEIVITGQASGQIPAINQQLSSNTIINVVSEEKIQELPDESNIKFNGIYYSANREYITHQRDYENGGGSNQYLGGVTYRYRDRKQEIETFSSALTGDNSFLGFDLNWGLSFAQSTSDYPYDYQLDFSEPSSSGVSGMRGGKPQLKDHPEKLIPYAYNNFRVATLAGGYYSEQDNLDKNQTVFLNLTRNYILGDLFSGEIKFGGKYNSKTRTNNQTQNFSPYYLGGWQPYEKLPGGTIQPKGFSGSYFEDFYQRYLENPLNNTVSLFEFLDSDPKSRTLYGLYELNPLLNRDKLRQ